MGRTPPDLTVYFPPIACLLCTTGAGGRAVGGVDLADGGGARLGGAADTLKEHGDFLEHRGVGFVKADLVDLAQEAQKGGDHLAIDLCNANHVAMLRGEAKAPDSVARLAQDWQELDAERPVRQGL